MNNPSARLAAQAIIQNREGKFLVVNHLLKKEAPWRFPGGKLDSVELSKSTGPILAARRELLEELGVWADPFAFEPLGTEDIFIDGDFWRVHYFLIRSRNWIGAPASREPEKLGELCWVTKEELLALDISGNMRAVAERAL